jgi:hypothetical protein
MADLVFQTLICRFDKNPKTKQPLNVGSYPSDLDEIGCRPHRLLDLIGYSTSSTMSTSEIRRLLRKKDY